MVVTTGPQLNGTWLEWKSFYYPDTNGPKWAYSVPNDVANQLNSAYSLMLDILTAQFWIILFSAVIAVLLREEKYTVGHPVFSDMMPALWNKNSDIFGAVTDTIMSLVMQDGKVKPTVRLWMTMLLVVALYAGQKALSILVAPKIILANAAPVNPEVVYVPSNLGADDKTITARFILNVPWALRALGTATAAIASLRPYVNVSSEIPIGTWNGTGGPQDIAQVTYSYRVTGADIGLQKYPDLTLNVTGSCFTEYNWYQGHGTLNEHSCLSGDAYNWFDNPSNTIAVSLLTGSAPTANFELGLIGLEGALPNSNATWGAIISAVGRQSFTLGTDPWYLTETLPVNTSSISGALYTVASGRPALSCWEDDVWSYGGQSANVSNLDTLTGLDLPAGMQDILEVYLSTPIIMSMGQLLGASALIAGSSAIGDIFDAGASSFQADLERLVVAAYVATTNVLTTTTSYPYGASSRVANGVLDASGQVLDGVGDFVVWTAEVAALNMAVVIAIPVLLVVVFLFGKFLLYGTPMGKAMALDAVELFFQLISTDKIVDIEFKRWKGSEWAFKDNNQMAAPAAAQIEASGAIHEVQPEARPVVVTDDNIGKA